VYSVQHGGAWLTFKPKPARVPIGKTSRTKAKGKSKFREKEENIVDTFKQLVIANAISFGIETDSAVVAARCYVVVLLQI
jgi:hypothetical protein